MTIFQILDDVIRDKTGKLSDDPMFENDFNVFMLARYLSMRRDLVKYADFVNRYSKYLTVLNIYHYLLDNIPRSDRPFIKYISKKKDVKDGDEKTGNRKTRKHAKADRASDGEVFPDHA